MSEHNPELKPTPHAPPNANIWPTASDFVEHPETGHAAEPNQPFPTWLYLLCGFALFMAGSSFTGFSTFGQGLYDQGPGGPTVTAGAATAVAEEDTPLTRGKRIYGGNCANCHQGTGEGQPGSYPPLVDSEYVVGNPDRLAAILLRGVSGPITVKGGAFGSMQMPAQCVTLNDKQIADVMTYIRSTWGNKAPEVKPDLVATDRAKTASQSNPYSEADLQKMPAK